MDFRLTTATRKWIKKSGLNNDYDDVSLAGASKILVDGTEAERELILKQINTSCTLHHSCQVILIHHSDCGAYSSAYKFATLEEEKVKQLEDMEKSKQLIGGRYPNMKIIKVWAQLKKDDGSEVEFSVIE